MTGRGNECASVVGSASSTACSASAIPGSALIVGILCKATGSGEETVDAVEFEMAEAVEEDEY